MSTRIRWFVCAVAAFLYVQGASAQPEQPRAKAEKERERLTLKKAGVVAKTIAEYKYSFGQPAKEGRRLMTVKYDGDGRKVEETRYAPNGTVAGIEAFSYDGSGRLVEHLWKTKDGTVYGRETCEYDNKGNLVRQVTYDDAGKIVFAQRYEYNDRGAMREWRTLRGDTALAAIEQYRYDGALLLETVRYKADGRLQSKTMCAYDTKGNCVEESSMMSDGVVQQKRMSTYDDRGNLTEEADVTADNQLLSKIMYRYDENGNRLELASYQGTKFLYKRISSYNAAGLEQELVFYGRLGEPETVRRMQYDVKK